MQQMGDATSFIIGFVTAVVLATFFYKLGRASATSPTERAMKVRRKNLIARAEEEWEYAERAARHSFIDGDMDAFHLAVSDADRAMATYQHLKVRDYVPLDD